MMRIKKDNTVMVINGKDNGKQGSVIEILAKKNKIKVKGVAIVTRHVKARKQGEVPGIVKSESFIDMSKVMPVCNSCKKPTMPKIKVVESKKMQVCKRCDEVI